MAAVEDEILQLWTEVDAIVRASTTSHQHRVPTTFVGLPVVSPPVDLVALGQISMSLRTTNLEISETIAAKLATSPARCAGLSIAFGMFCSAVAIGQTPATVILVGLIFAVMMFAFLSLGTRGWVESNLESKLSEDAKRHALAFDAAQFFSVAKTDRDVFVLADGSRSLEPLILKTLERMSQQT